MVTTIRLRGQVTADGQLVFNVPVNLPPGDVDITIEVLNADEQFSDAEIEDLLTFSPVSGAEMIAAGLTGGWADMDISDPVAFVDDLRRKQKERHGW